MYSGVLLMSFVLVEYIMTNKDWSGLGTEDWAICRLKFIFWIFHLTGVKNEFLKKKEERYLGLMFPAVVHWCRYTSVTMYVMAKVQTSAGMTKERKFQITLSIQSVGGLQWSGHGTHIHRSHQMMCLGFDEREDATRTSVAQTQKNDNRHNGTINNTKGSSRTCRGLWPKKQTPDRPVLPQRVLLGSVVSNRRHSLWFFRAPSVRRLQRRPPPSFITMGVHLSTVLPFLPFLPLFRSLPLYSSPPCVVVRGGFLLSVQHQTTAVSTGARAAQQGGCLNMLYWLLSFSKPKMNWPHLFFSQTITDIRHRKGGFLKKKISLAQAFDFNMSGQRAP